MLFVKTTVYLGASSGLRVSDPFADSYSILELNEKTVLFTFASFFLPFEADHGFFFPLFAFRRFSGTSDYFQERSAEGVQPTVHEPVAALARRLYPPPPPSSD